MTTTAISLRQQAICETDEVIRRFMTLRSGVSSWQCTPVEFALGTCTESAAELLLWMKSIANPHTKCASMTKTQALAQAALVETELAKARLTLNQSKTEWFSQGLLHTSNFRAALKQLKVALNEAPQTPLNWATTVEHV